MTYVILFKRRRSPTWECLNETFSQKDEANSHAEAMRTRRAELFRLVHVAFVETPT